ncbi:hypothetical protein VST7929_02449 [Vibrio stylophorae]|uniref:Glycosyltransferase subfamily 4-like N-terminal domain-containing protein n=1 Tax=Vibrio stylophorae TaxID=659351 RepID=A0ABM8ZW12_9VIBR|nr:glycosyltransferase family 4 protein [Vibrio stylophorae]CAH0534506.1 hypothetical protein VST7929_02449 [Vibrio stylophorae]
MTTIVLLFDSAKFGGIETHVVQLAHLLYRKGIPVSVLFWQNHFPEYAQTHLINAGIHCAYLNRSLNALNRYVKQCSPCLIHGHGYKGAIMARVASLLTHTPCVTTFHAGELGAGRVALYECLNRYTAFIGRNLAVSELIKSKIPFKAEICHNFVELPALAILPNENTTEAYKIQRIAFVGRLNRDKGADRLTSLVEHSSAQLSWHCFGEGEFDIEHPRCHMHGHVANMQDYWSQIDLLVMPSRFEGLPLVALEAMGYGIPVLATDVGDLKYLLPSDFLVPEHDWLSLSDKINHLAQLNSGEILEIHHHMRGIIESRFSSDARWPQLQEIYNIG